MMFFHVNIEDGHLVSPLREVTGDLLYATTHTAAIAAFDGVQEAGRGESVHACISIHRAPDVVLSTVMTR